MKKKLKFLFGAAPLAALPILALAASCTNKTEDGVNAGYQSRILKETITKNKIITKIADNYLEAFYEDELKLANSDEAKKDPILFLMTDTTTSSLNAKTKELFKYYAAAKLKEDPQFFWNLKSQFINANVDTNSFDPTPYAIPDDQQLNFILKNSDVITNSIRLELEKMLLIQIYFLKDRTEYKKLANNENGLDKYQLSMKAEIDKKDTPTSKRDLYNSFNFADDNLYLLKYLVDNPMIESWSFTDDRDMNLRLGQANISSFNDFNNLAKYQPSGIEQFEFNPTASANDHLIMTGSAENFDLKNLRAYKGFIKNAINAGDLSTSLTSLQNDLSSIFGFLDPKNNIVYSQDSFKFSKILAQEKNNPKIIETAALNTKAQTDKLTSFDSGDFTFEGLTQDSTNKSIYTKQIKVGSDSYTLQFEQKGTITFDGQALTVPMQLSVRELPNRHFYDFKSKLEYNATSKTFKGMDQLPEYNLDKYPTSVDVVKDNKIEAHYVVKVAPLYTNKKFKDAEQKDVERKVFSFDLTPWSNEKEQVIIANNIIAANTASLFREAVKYFKELGFRFNLQNINQDVLDALKVEGLA
ncbi:hypothetical protein HGG64_00900 [Mycoplasma phocoeninasale]|uniref:P60-like lipoprotein n=1 Tax=Mycoplasma phocoeninasale TaxID=2726117 RepID=A0A858U2T5_9MOLU|nr:hypothetical protein [Mycoplasma phocoeninasale]QJG66271.1 hypothetical protein HGG64_00900 [Mycoplasma phocoeninasale]